MKRWFIFLVAFGTCVWILSVAVRKNLEVLRVPSPGEVETISLTDEAASTSQPVPGEASLPPSWDSPAVSDASDGETEIADSARTEDIARRVFALLELFREANQKFLDDDLTQAQSIFRRALDQSFDLKTGSAAQEEIKKHLFVAVRARLESIRFYQKMQESSEAEGVEHLWAKNIGELKNANRAVTEVIRLTARMIQARQMESVVEDRDSGLLLQDLEKSARGILVLAKSAHS